MPTNLRAATPNTYYGRYWRYNASLLETDALYFIWFVSSAAAPPFSLPYFSKAARPPAA
jgi:hypothetical protein